MIFKNMKKIKIFEDKHRVESIRNSVKEGVEKVQSLVDAFNEMGFAPLNEFELPRLMSDPLKLYKERTDELELPPNVNRERYLQLMNLPSPAKMMKAWLDLKPYDLVRSPEFVKMVHDKILVDEKALAELTDRFALFVEEGSAQHMAAKDYFAFVDLLNKIGEKRQSLFNESDGTNKILDIVHIKREYGLNVAVPTMEKLRRFINS